MKYGAIAQQVEVSPLRVLCRVLGVSRSGYYAWRSQELSRRARENEALVMAIQQIHRVVDQTYGSPRMQEELVGQGYACGRHRVARLMRVHGVMAKMTVRFRRLTKAGGRRAAAPNLLMQQFTVPGPNLVWAADITYIATAEGHLYLAVVLDLHNREVVGWAMTSRLGAELVVTALQQALDRRPIARGLIHHSDRDGLYSCAAYQHLLAAHQITPSMSGKGNCYDNACVESFFASLKNELVAFERFRTRQEANDKIFAWIEVFYNRVRRHSTLGYLSPVEFQKQAAQA